MLTSSAPIVNVDSNVQARIEQVIVVESKIGRGVAGDPVRRVVEYFDFSGLLLARHDPWLEDDRASRAIARPEGQ